MGRNESDQQLQDYLRQRGAPHGYQHGQQNPEQFQQAQAAALAAVPHAQAAYAQAQAAGMQQAMQAMAAGKAGELVHDRGQNMQRVASLDMLRALVMNPGQMQLSPGSAMNAPAARGGNPKGHPGMNEGMQQKASGSAKQRQLDQVIDKNMDKTEIRRVRRMLSNRESARRSRRRKQEHLQTLEEKLKGCENDRLVMEEKIKCLIMDNNNLKEENKKLRDALKALDGQQTKPESAQAVGTSPKKETSGREEDSPGKLKSETSPSVGSKRANTESLKRKASVDELSKRFKGENDAGNCTLQNAHRESWQDLSAAEKVH